MARLLLPRPAEYVLETAARRLLQPPDAQPFDFSQPLGEPALIPANSVSWRVFKNPLALFVGGIAAVILELAEPRVRTGVWEHTSFRSDPVPRLQRTGLAAMVTVYGARSRAEAMIARINRLHAKVAGETPEGEAYRATDTDLLTWVHATACFGFANAYSRYAGLLSPEEFDRFYAESLPAARLFGAWDAPACTVEVETLFRSTRPRLEPSPIVFEFLNIMYAAPILPAALRPIQRMLIRAGVEVVPEDVRERLGLTAGYGLRSLERVLVPRMGRIADRVLLRTSPPVHACQRLGLAADYLYRA